MRSRLPARVLFLTSMDSNLTGGGRSIRDLLAHLDRSVVQGIVGSGNVEATREILGDSQMESVGLQWPEKRGEEAQGLVWTAWRKPYSVFMEILRVNRDVMRAVRDARVEAVWGRNVKAVLFGGLGARRAKARVIWDVGFELPSRGAVRILHWMSLILVTQVVTQGATQPCSVFGPLASRLFRKKFRTITPGVAGERRDRLIAAGKRREGEQGCLRVLCVASISARKGQETLVRAIAGLRCQGVDVRLRLVGPVAEARYRRKLERLVAEKNLTNVVEILGWREDVPELMGESDVLVLTSENEGLPHVIREAMLGRLPVVTTAVGVIPEVVKDGRTGMLVPPRGVDELAAKLRILACCPEVRQGISEQAFQVADAMFSVERWAKEYSVVLANMQ